MSQRRIAFPCVTGVSATGAVGALRGQVAAMMSGVAATATAGGGFTFGGSGSARMYVVSFGWD